MGKYPVSCYLLWSAINWKEGLNSPQKPSQWMRR